MIKITDEMLEKVRLALEKELIYRRDNRINVLRNNGLCIKEANGKESHIIRMEHENAFLIGLRASGIEYEYIK